MVRLAQISIVLLFVLLSACQPLRSRAAQPLINSQARQVAPQTTDPAIDDWLEPHVVIPPLTPAQGRLFLFFPGSFGQPINQQLILEQAALHGYHAIGLRYPNRWTINSLCEPSADLACFEQTRSEIISGVDQSPLLNITPANSITNRLIKLLQYLQRSAPDEGWGQFLDSNGQPQWARISASGHSQGGGHAALLGKQVALARVCSFSAPADSLLINQQRVTAPWLSQPGATPATAYYGLAHQQEDGFDQITQNWRELGMAGEIVLVEGSTTPYNGAQLLSTRLAPTRPGEYHGSTAVDRNTPLLADGSPALAAAWAYLCFPQAAATGSVVFLPLMSRMEASTNATAQGGGVLGN